MESAETEGFATEFSPIEQELVVFKALTETLDSMLNHEVMTVRGDDPNTEIVFATSTHMRLFNILLVDFLSRQNKIVVGSDASYLVLLEKVCQAPSIGDQNSVGDLAQATQCLHSWLNAEIEVCVWLPSIDNEVDLAIRRHDFIYICGNIGDNFGISFGRNSLYLMQRRGINSRI
ncbi:hypothetical protein [Pelagibius sp. Alg239-R121]|uniref:hypothetical protein n=1 Tax=Pelagibius sp. Alg239-R121 TaxID=2993448 RepID=UPI0024A7071B|nr:hypothetical protein [Pelagibius sp. Alg239-R121]